MVEVLSIGNEKNPFIKNECSQLYIVECTDEAHTVMCGTSPQGCRVIHPSQTKKSLSQIEIRFLRYVIILGKKKTELPLFITMTKSHFLHHRTLVD